MARSGDRRGDGRLCAGGSSPARRCGGRPRSRGRPRASVPSIHAPWIRASLANAVGEDDYSLTNERIEAYPAYAVLLVELEQGPRMISSLVGGDPEKVTFDMPVQLVCEKVSDEIALPRFKPA